LSYRVGIKISYPQVCPLQCPLELYYKGQTSGVEPRNDAKHCSFKSKGSSLSFKNDTKASPSEGVSRVTFSLKHNFIFRAMRYARHSKIGLCEFFVRNRVYATIFSLGRNKRGFSFHKFDKIE
jgi:hypothetical protein